MSDRSRIDWCDATIQPITGCTRIDTETGCRNCYACRLATTRLRHLPQYAGLTSSSVARAGERVDHHWTGEVRFNPEELEKPLRWRKPRTIFVSSMGDLFHEAAPAAAFPAIMQCAKACQQHTFVLLTKRERTMHRLISDWCDTVDAQPMRNVAVGVSCSTQEECDRRLPGLLDTPARWRFVSLEPLLERVDLSDWLSGLSGAILGAETGPGARPMNPDWAREVRDQCAAADVSFFLKALDASGRVNLDGWTYDELPWGVQS